MKIGNVFIGQARAAISPSFESALKLREQAKMRAEMPIGVKQIALQNVAVGTGWICPKARVVVILVFVSDFAADREKPIVVPKSYVLDAINRFFNAIMIREEAPFLFVAQHLQCRPLFLAFLGSI